MHTLHSRFLAVATAICLGLIFCTPPPARAQNAVPPLPTFPPGCNASTSTSYNAGALLWGVGGIIGSAVMLTSNYALTAGHVVRGYQSMPLTVEFAGTEYVALVSQVSEDGNLALLELAASPELPPDTVWIGELPPVGSTYHFWSLKQRRGMVGHVPGLGPSGQVAMVSPASYLVSFNTVGEDTGAGIFNCNNQLIGLVVGVTIFNPPADEAQQKKLQQQVIKRLGQPLSPTQAQQLGSKLATRVASPAAITRFLCSQGLIVNRQVCPVAAVPQLPRSAQAHQQAAP